MLRFLGGIDPHTDANDNICFLLHYLYIIRKESAAHGTLLPYFLYLIIRFFEVSTQKYSVCKTNYAIAFLCRLQNTYNDKYRNKTSISYRFIDIKCSFWYNNSKLKFV